MNGTPVEIVEIRGLQQLLGEHITRKKERVVFKQTRLMFSPFNIIPLLLIKVRPVTIMT